MVQEELDFISQLMKAHATSMAQLTYRRTGSAELAEDLVQETFLLACSKSKTIFVHPNPVAWLYNVLNKLTMREMDKAYRTAEVPPLNLDIVGEADIALPMEYYLPVGLTLQERNLILMRVDQGLSFSEIAEKTGVWEATCRKQFSRAIARCRSLLVE